MSQCPFYDDVTSDLLPALMLGVLQLHLLCHPNAALHSAVRPCVAHRGPQGAILQARVAINTFGSVLFLLLQTPTEQLANPVQECDNNVLLAGGWRRVSSQGWGATCRGVCAEGRRSVMTYNSGPCLTLAWLHLML